MHSRLTIGTIYIRLWASGTCAVPRAKSYDTPLKLLQRQGFASLTTRHCREEGQGVLCQGVAATNDLETSSKMQKSQALGIMLMETTGMLLCRWRASK